MRDALSRFQGEAGALPVVSGRDGGGRELCFDATASAPPGRAPEATRHLTFLFRDWELGIHSRHYTPAGWARRNFAINLALSFLLTAVVAGGVLFALRAASRAMRLSQMKSDFVSNVSHELRTPLASIRVFGELLRLGKAETPEKVRVYGEYIETESRRLTQLINNILDLARIESGRKSYELAPADLEEVVRETLRTFRPSLEQAGFRLGWQPPAAPLPAIALDTSAVGQSLANLLDNAVKYSGIARDIDVGLAREGDFAVVTVADHGVGIAEGRAGEDLRPLPPRLDRPRPRRQGERPRASPSCATSPRRTAAASRSTADPGRGAASGSCCRSPRPLSLPRRTPPPTPPSGPVHRPSHPSEA